MVDIVAALTLLSFEIIYAAARLEPGGQTLTPVEKGDVAVASIFAFLYLMLIILCVFAIVRSHGHRAPYLYLIFTVFFAFLASISYAANIVDSNIVATFVTWILFRTWARALLFVSIMSLLFNRRNLSWTASRGKLKKVHIAVHGALGLFSVVAFALGTASAAIGGIMLADTNPLSKAKDHSADLVVATNTISKRYEYLVIAFDSLVIASVLFLVIYAIVLCEAMDRCRITDKVTRITVLAIVPLYTALTIVELVSIILEIRPNLSTSHLDTINISWNLITDICFCAIGVILIAMSMRPSMWKINVNLQPAAIIDPEPLFFDITANTPMREATMLSAGRPPPNQRSSMRHQPAPEVSSCPRLSLSSPTGYAMEPLNPPNSLPLPETALPKRTRRAAPLVVTNE